MKTLSNVWEKMDATVYKWQMRLSALALVALAVIFAALCVTETYAANEMNLTPRSKGEYAALYYQFVQDYVKRLPYSKMETQFMDADLVDFNKDGQYELVCYLADEAPTEKVEAMVYVFPLNYVQNYYTPLDGTREPDQLFSLGMFGTANYDIYITEFNGKPALVMNNASSGTRTLRWIADDGKATKTTVSEKTDAALYKETGKAVSTWGVQAKERWRMKPDSKANVVPEATGGERLLEYVNE